jgi:hypothetical protein
MSTREEPSYLMAARNAVNYNESSSATIVRELVARIDRDASALKAAQPRTITTAAQLEGLPFGSALQTSDSSDVVVLRCEGNNFRNQSGAELSATDLWRYGTRPFTVIYEPAVTS